MAKRCLSEKYEIRKRAKIDPWVPDNHSDSEDLKRECDKLTIQITEVARKNRAYISEAQNYKTWLAEASQKLRQEKAESDKLKAIIRNETEQRNDFRKKWHSAIKDLDQEKKRSSEKRALEGRLIDQIQLLNAERTKVCALNQQVQALEEKLKAAEEHNARLTSLLVKFPPPRM